MTNTGQSLKEFSLSHLGPDETEMKALEQLIVVNALFQLIRKIQVLRKSCAQSGTYGQTLK